MTKISGAAVLLCASVAALSACDGNEGLERQSAEARYRMTLEVVTPDGVKNGSAVWSRGISKSIGPISRYNSSFKAEAVAVDLPNGQTLFMLVKGQEGMLDAYFPELMADRVKFDRVAHVSAIASSNGSKTLPCTPEAESAWPHKAWRTSKNYDNYCPMLVTFKDIKDPSSVQLVDRSNLSASFGAGYKLNAITVQVTDEPVTAGIRQRFGWLGKYPEPRLQDIPQGGTIRPTFAQSIAHGDFRRGVAE